MVSTMADMFCGPGIAKASTRALYMGYCRMASRGPCQVEAKLMIIVSTRDNEMK